MKHKGEKWREAMREKARELDKRGLTTEADYWYRAVIADARREAAQS